MNKVILAMAISAAITSGTALAADPVALSKQFKSDCLACHSVDKKMVGPAWKDVAAKYKGNAGAQNMLVEKVIKGGKGNWDKVTGGMIMTPHPAKPSKDEIDQIVAGILELK